MWFARERVRTASWSWPTDTGSRSGESLKELLDGAFKDVTNEEAIVAGASELVGHTDLGRETLRYPQLTLMLPPIHWVHRQLDGVLGSARRRDGHVPRRQVSRLKLCPIETARQPCCSCLEAVNALHTQSCCSLGDSGFSILRPHATDSLPPTPPASPVGDEKDATAPPPGPSTTYSVLHAQEPQVHFFNAPRQLSKIPAAELKRAGGEEGGNWLIDRPKDADTFSMQLEDGDVVMLFTDGYSDK